MAWDYFPEGKKISGIKVLMQTAWGPNGFEVRQDVACMECGAHHKMTHKYALSRATKKVSGCVKCSRAKAAEQARRERRNAERASVPAGALHAGPHLWWPIKQPGGKMGGRYDTGHGTNKVIGTEVEG